MRLPVPVCFAACAVLAASALAAAQSPWMNEDAMRTDFIGETLQGYYNDGRAWTASYAKGGQYQVSEGELHAVGSWYFRGRAFCFLYGPPHWPLGERCGAVSKLSANCYQFHRIYPGADAPADEQSFRPETPWASRGWRQKEPSTCEARPSV